MSSSDIGVCLVIEFVICTASRFTVLKSEISWSHTMKVIFVVLSTSQLLESNECGSQIA